MFPYRLYLQPIPSDTGNPSSTPTSTLGKERFEVESSALQGSVLNQKSGYDHSVHTNHLCNSALCLSTKQITLTIVKWTQLFLFPTQILLEVPQNNIFGFQSTWKLYVVFFIIIILVIEEISYFHIVLCKSHTTSHPIWQYAHPFALNHQYSTASNSAFEVKI